MVPLEKLLKKIMDKDKLIKALLWLSAFSLSVIISALSFYIGFNNHRHGDNTILIIGFFLLPIVFFCAYRGIKLVLDIIFN